LEGINVGSRALAAVCRRNLLIASAATVALAASAAPAMGAAVTGVNGSDLNYEAAVGETNNVRVTQAGLTVIFDDDVAITTTNPACAAAGGDVSCTVVLPTSMTVSLDDLNDTTTLTGVTFPTQQSGAAGNDILRGGADADFFFDEAGADTYAGGDGFDGIQYGLGAPVNVSLDGVANDGLAGEGDNVGTDIEDVFSFGTGPDTVTGNASSNLLQGGTGADQIDGGPGNDSLLGGSGDDTLRARDGFSDRVSCDAGNADIAVVDTLDTVSGCETVQRADVGNANDVPEDRPPAIAIQSPGPNAVIPATGATVNVSAMDDRGVASVQVLDDGSPVGSDAAAPFAIPYFPTGGDVGADTLVAIATDTAGQTATAIRPVRVSKFRPRRVSLVVTPSRDRSAPYRFRAGGAVALPPRVSRTQGCKAGVVLVTVKRGTRTVASRRANLSRNCTYAAALAGRRGANRITARFLGNDVMSARSSATRTARGG
jgi:Ca2+-binding RTX toxin-like protein